MHFGLILTLIVFIGNIANSANFNCDQQLASTAKVEKCLSDYATEVLKEMQPGFFKALTAKIEREAIWHGRDLKTWPVKAKDAMPLSAFFVEVGKKKGCSIFNSNHVSVKRESGKRKRVLEAKHQIEEVAQFLYDYHLKNNGIKTSRLFQLQKVELCADPYQPVAKEKPRSFAYTQNTLILQLPVKRKFFDYGYETVASADIMLRWMSGDHFKPNRILKKRELINYNLHRLWPLLNPIGKIRLFVRKFLTEQNIEISERIACEKSNCSRFISEAKGVLKKSALKKIMGMKLKSLAKLSRKTQDNLFKKMDMRIEQLGLAAIQGPDLSIDIKRKTRFSIVNVQNAHVINVSAILGALGNVDQEYLAALKKHSPKPGNHSVNITHSNGISLVNVDTFDYVNVNVNLFVGLAPANLMTSIMTAF